MSSSSDNHPGQIDSYTSKVSKDTSTNQKIKEVEEIIKSSKFGMLTSISSSGELNSRMMSPISTDSLNFKFIGNLSSGKFDELKLNPQINLSFVDSNSTNWISISGKAIIIKHDDEAGEEKIKSFWTKDLEAWFGNEGGKFDGTYKDPRVGLIEIESKEIRYWYKTTTSLGQAYEVAKGALTGEVAAPGVLRIINSEELNLLKKLNENH